LGLFYDSFLKKACAGGWQLNMLLDRHIERRQLSELGRKVSVYRLVIDQ